MATKNQIGYGSQGSDVTELQKLLNQNGYNLSADGIVGNNTWGVQTQVKTTPNAADGSAAPANTGFHAAAGSAAPGYTGFQHSAYKESDAVKQAQAMLQQQLAQKPGAYQSQWQSQLDDIIGKIMNREKFSYDLNGDALYQQYKDQSTTQGQMAMMDTMGQAQAMTGGYGNSYAQSVGQQAYQSHLQQLNDKIPELYQLALNKYQMEGNDLYNQYSLLGAQEEQDYGRYRDTVSDYNQELDRLQSQYDNERNFDHGQHADDRAYNYQVERDKVTDAQWQKEFDEAMRRWQLQWDAEHPAKSSGGGGGSSGGSGGGDNPKPPAPPDQQSETETEMREYVKNMLDKATGSQFNPEQVINANNKLKDSEKIIAKAILKQYIDSGYMK